MTNYELRDRDEFGTRGRVVTDICNASFVIRHYYKGDSANAEKALLPYLYTHADAKRFPAQVLRIVDWVRTERR